MVIFVQSLEVIRMVPLLLSVEQAAERLGGVSVWSIYNWLSKGKIRKTKIGSRVMIAESDLQAFIASCNPEPATSANEAKVQ